jgi:parallel beta-helix repeat protein
MTGDGNTLQGNTASKIAGFGFNVDAIMANIFENNKCEQNVLD